MEYKHELLATASSQAEAACAHYTVDRLSNVSREVAHHILSLVNFRDLTRMGSVSKRCRVLFINPIIEIFFLVYRKQAATIELVELY
jgi:hypothetical protein